MNAIMKRRLVPATPDASRKNPGKSKIQVLLFFLIIVCGNAWAQDEFHGLKCGADIPKSLVGKRLGGLLWVLDRHEDLGIRNLGGTIISDRLVLHSWEICGSEYELLMNTKSGLIRDVLPFPGHSPTSPQFIGRCQADGKKISEAIVAVLNNRTGYNFRDRKPPKNLLKAIEAWRIDETKEKFAKQSTEKLECPVEYIVTEDGGP
jgi:hypothetical protein